jgi:hypothetical protein
MESKLDYFRRIFSAYFFKKSYSQLSFWHETPKINEEAIFDGKTLASYYMTFSDKANYQGPFDENGIPLLNYQGKIGKQYNPIAIAQYGLAHYNLYKKSGNQNSRSIFLKQADWLVVNSERNKQGLEFWMHHFDFEYKKILKAPWYSALAQGQGVSLLSRAYFETKDKKYFLAAKKAFQSLLKDNNNGGVQYRDENNNVWLEEYIVDPPTHILNGFIWTLWGVYDYYLLTQDSEYKNLLDNCVKTLKKNLQKYDFGFWSLYDLSNQFLKNLASPFYHKLHIVQLEILAIMTGEKYFREIAEKWEDYQKNIFKKNLSLIYKSFFKIFYW